MRRSPAPSALPALFTLLAFVLPAAAYDPLTVNAAGGSIELTVRDARRGRDIPLRVHLPADTQPAPVVLFSHGLGGTKEGGAFLGGHWSARGYVAVFMQHAGSDDGAWRDVPPARRMSALKAAGSMENFMHRVQDVPAVLDQLALWGKSGGHALAGRMDLERVGMSGHSFGAITTQAVGGQGVALGGQRFTDARIKAALPMSHSPPKLGSAATAFGTVKIPWLVMTGTHDDSIVADFTPADRALVFASLPPGGKYELILHLAEHSAFTERALPGDKQPRNPNHHRVILALSTAFWDAYLRDDDDAKAWLDGDGPRTVMEKEDGWRRK